MLVQQKSLLTGDARSVSIAAASILAKTHRHARMAEWDAVNDAIRRGALQELCDAGSLGSFIFPLSHGLASLFVRARPRKRRQLASASATRPEGILATRRARF